MLNTRRFAAFAIVAGLIFSTSAFAAGTSATGPVPPAKGAPAATQPVPANKGAAPATVQPGPQTAAPAAAITTKINLNDPALTVDQLDTLPGIGEPRAKAILESRKKDGLFIAKTDLVKRGLIPQSVFDGLKDRVALVDVNNTCAADMQAILDGIGDARAANIVKGREYKKIDDIKDKADIPGATFDKFAHELTLTPKAKKAWSCFTK